MSTTAASAENTMNYLKENKERKQELSYEKCDDENVNVDNEMNDVDPKIYFKRMSGNGDSDDDMIVIILEEEEQNHECKEVNGDEGKEGEKEGNSREKEGNSREKEGNSREKEEVKVGKEEGEEEEEEKVGKEEVKGEEKEEDKNKKKHCREYENNGEELFIQLRDKLTMKKLYPLLPCTLISSFGAAMEHVEYFDIANEERKKLVIDLVKSLAYSNNEYGSRECFEYFVQHNMVDDIIKTVIDCTKNKYDINRFPHTNRKLVLSYVSLSNKIKSPKPIKFDSLFDFKINLCGLKRFFKMKEKDETKQT
jgi:hypothetical protein